MFVCRDVPHPEVDVAKPNSEVVRRRQLRQRPVGKRQRSRKSPDDEDRASVHAGILDQSRGKI
jgi:hypothetical protein